MTSFCLSTPCAPKALITPPSSAKGRFSARCSPKLPPPSFPQRTELIPPSRNRRNQSQVVRMAPEEERLTRRNPLDFPIEWDRPKPGRRPDIFPQFSPMKTPLPPPMPYDPPEEDEEEEEKKEEEEEDPDKEEPDQPERQ
uniref:Uncharacterized protein n=1 Tax=Kalanchoe fedtschenkoi TaxID=63787 RepID=A0A7N0T4X1_KALFE